VTIQIGSFDVEEPVPELRRPRLLVALQPWVDVGSVGTMALSFLEQAWGAQPLATLTRPGRFYDFTRYRPMLYRQGGQRQVTVPTTFAQYALGPGERDWLFLHALEPHANGEDYVEGLTDLIRHMGVTEYVMAGSMYAPVPHTRPIAASGGSSDDEIKRRLLSLGVRESTYEGPTTILALLTTTVPQQNIATVSMILQLPAYAQIERDFCGVRALLTILSDLYELSLDLSEMDEQVQRQTAAINESVQADVRLQTWVQELETLYDAARDLKVNEEDPTTVLSPELENFLQDVERRWTEHEGR